MLHAVIMAGGAGTRFWPASRRLLPKQLLDLRGGRTMIQDTVARLGDLVPAERLMVVTNQALVQGISEQLPDLPASAILGEPCKRDTAPCIGLAAALILRQDPEAVMVVMPADHLIEPDGAFRAAIGQAVRLVEADPARIVTFGIRPSYPAETFGYIERGALESPDADGGPGPMPVHAFHEKPSREIAEQYVASGRHFWNSGIFVWRAATIRDALHQYQPTMAGHLDRIAAAAGSDRFPSVLQEEFSAIKGKSIDYAVMEKYSPVLVMEAPFSWDDVGNWQSLARMRGADNHGNTVVGRHLGLRTTGTIVRTDDEHLVVTLGLKDCIVVHTPDATLVARRDDEESIRELVELIRERGWEEYL